MVLTIRSDELQDHRAALALVAEGYRSTLSRGERETQIQLPYDLEGSTVALSMESGGSLVRSSLPLLPAAPAILVDRDGTPMAMDGVSGALVDAGNPARAGGLVQILASGLGRVTPNWPVGMVAPAGESVFQVPGRFTAANQHELVHDGRSQWAKKVAPACMAAGIGDLIIPACASGHWFAGPHGVLSRRPAH